jgi:nicotinamidase-related amidase
LLKLEGRYYRPLPTDRPGFEIEALELDPARTALIGMHCWNIGCPDGPPPDKGYWVGMGFPIVLAEAERIMREVIRPAMDAARRAGVLVCHVEPEGIGLKHPEAQESLDPPPPPSQPTTPPVTDWRERMVARFHGEGYATHPPYATMDRAAIVALLPGEVYAYQTGQLDRLLQARGIENLIYSGFATDMCVLRAPGGVEPMAGFGYRMLLMRDATLGIECLDTFAERIATRWATRYFETHFGDTISAADFIHACQVGAAG